MMPIRYLSQAPFFHKNHVRMQFFKDLLMKIIFQENPCNFTYTHKNDVLSKLKFSLCKLEWE